jgi:hypothetical protein
MTSVLCSFCFGADAARSFALELTDDVRLESQVLSELAQICTLGLADLLVGADDRECKRVEVLP